MEPIITINEYPIGWEWLDRVPFEVPGHTKEYTEGFTEEMVIPYRTEELNPYPRYHNQEINNNHLHSEHIRLQIREILQIPLSDITIIDIISLP